MINPLIRPFGPQDRAACLSVFDSNVPDFFLPTERADFETDLDEADAYLVLEIGGEVVACGGVALENNVGFFVWGMVARPWHRRGLGRLLVIRRLQLLRDLRAPEVRLDTSPDTAPFYARLGFHEVARVPDGYGPGLDRVDMTLAFSPDTT